MSRQLTIRGVPDDVAMLLEELSRARGQSMNTTVKQILKTAVDPDERMSRLRRYVTWREDDLDELSEGLARQRRIDADVWS